MRQKSNSSNNQSVMLTEIVQEPLRLALRWFSRTDSPPAPSPPASKSVQEPRMRITPGLCLFSSYDQRGAQPSLS